MEDVQTALKATTALVAASDHKTIISDWTKAAVMTLKNTSTNEKTELQRLNLELKKYLGDVKVLEELNSTLIAQVEAERKLSTPKIMDKSRLDDSLQSARVELENEAFSAVEHEIKLEEAKSLNMELNEQSKFLVNEAELARKKIQILQHQMSEYEAQKEALTRGAHIAEESIIREEERISKAKLDLEQLLKSLSSERSRSKKVEFEIHTYMDELAFRKEVHKEELEDLRKRVTQGPLSTLDLNNFYKSELISAVKQIRDDFHTLNERQLDDFKKHKEGELAVAVAFSEEEKAFAQQVKTRRETSVERDSQSAKEMEVFIKDSKPEIEILSKRNNDLMNKLAALENNLYEMRLKNGDSLDRQQFEIDKIKQQNDEMINELEYWGRVTRAKLENEIQTYRSILNCQVKLMHDSASEATLTLQNIKTTPAPPASTNVEKTKEESSVKVTKSEEKEAIELLKQVFNYMDSDKSGTINSKGKI